MNRVFWERVVIFAAGLFLGSFSTYQFTKDKMEKQVEEELDSIREVYGKHFGSDAKVTEGRYTTKPGNIDIRDHASTLPNIHEESTFISSDMDMINAAKKEGRTAYNQIVKAYQNTESGDPRPELSRIPEPYVIDTMKFSEENHEFDKLTIYYYAGDDTLVDEGEEIIVDVRMTIGDQALDNFGNGSVNQDIVYVRNERLSIDYEVVRVETSYSETVLGQYPD